LCQPALAKWPVVRDFAVAHLLTHLSARYILYLANPLLSYEQKRYHVKRVIEFYAATEGNANLFNSTGKAGPLGYVPVWVANLVYPIK
jgi:hypothetical protein